MLSIQKKNIDEENDCQPEILEELLSNEDFSTLPKSVPLMSSKEYIKLRKTKCVLRYHVPNNLSKPEAYAHHLLFMFYPFRTEESLKETPSGTYSEKLTEPGVLEIINENKRICEPYGELVDQAFIHFRENISSGLDPYGEQENDDLRTGIVEESEDENFPFDENNYQGGANPQTSVTISDDKLNEKIRSLNEEQRNLFDFVSSWTRNLLKSLRIKGAKKPDPFHIFLTGSAGCGKSHTLTTIRYYLEKALSYGSGELTKERMLMLAPTGVAAVHVDGSTIHSALGIVPDRKKSKQVSRISDKKKCSLRQRFSELKVIIIDEISMVSNHLLLYIHQRLTDILGCNDGTPFAGVSIITCGDFYQLPPIRASPV